MTFVSTLADVVDVDDLSVVLQKLKLSNFDPLADVIIDGKRFNKNYILIFGAMTLDIYVERFYC
jgi:hypothetical protein